LQEALVEGGQPILLRALDVLLGDATVDEAEAHTHLYYLGLLPATVHLVNGDRFCSSSEREPARVEQARVATIEAAQADGDPGRVAVEETIHRFFVDGVSARDAQAYFDRTYHARHAARFTRIWGRWQTDEQRQLRLGSSSRACSSSTPRRCGTSSPPTARDEV
jgi:hypothetical protein